MLVSRDSPPIFHPQNLILTFNLVQNKSFRFANQTLFPPHPHPGWCQAHGQQLQPPKGYGGEARGFFSWKRYLDATGAVAAPRECFPHTSQKVGGMGEVHQDRLTIEMRPNKRLSIGLGKIQLKCI